MAGLTVRLHNLAGLFSSSWITFKCRVNDQTIFSVKLHSKIQLSETNMTYMLECSECFGGLMPTKLVNCTNIEPLQKP